VVVPPARRVASTRRGVFLLFLAREGHYLSCAVVAGVDRWFRMLSAVGGLLMMARASYVLVPVTARVLHAPALVTTISDAAVFVVFLAFFLFFSLYILISFYS
jgi:uncharacterized membrane protein